MPEDAEVSAHSTEKPAVRSTPSPKSRADPSMECEPVNDEEKRHEEPHHPERVLKFSHPANEKFEHVNERLYVGRILSE